MSWQSYVDQSLLGTGKIDKAAIFSAKGDSVWAATPGFTIEPKEVEELIKGMTEKEPTDPAARVQWVNPLARNGLHIGKVKYFVLKVDERSCYAKQGKEGIICVKTKQSILIAHYPETVQPGEATKVVEQLGDYLIGVGY